MDSGLQCLGMILQYYRIPANLQNIAHEYTAVSGRVTQLDIVHAAKILGLRAKVVNVPTTRLSKMNVPAISVNQNGDYYVIARVSDEKVLVQKPGHQPETVAREEFLQSWDGGAILLTPISYFESRQTGQIIARVRELESIRDFLTSNGITVALDAL